MLDAAVAGRRALRGRHQPSRRSPRTSPCSPTATSPRERIRATVVEAGGELLRSATVFDVYEGEQVPEGKRSLALRLEFQAPDRTLTDAEVAEVRAGIVAALESIGAELRG